MMLMLQIENDSRSDGTKQIYICCQICHIVICNMTGAACELISLEKVIEKALRGHLHG